MEQICALTGTKFTITDADLAFYQRMSPVFEGARYPIPPPKLCPEMRLRRRLAYNNQIYVYPRKDSLTGKSIISQYPEDSVFPVYDNDNWWSDSWDALSYGRDYDFSRPFFEQFSELELAVPHLSRNVLNNENCDYCNNASANRDCYLMFNTSLAQGCMYSENAWGSVDCIECSFTKGSELCYDCIMCTRCYNSQSCQDCEDCRDSYFLLNCRSCTDCIGCVNLRRKQYCIFNEQLSKSVYFERKEALELHLYSKREQFKTETRKFWMNHPCPHAWIRQAESSTGNYLNRVKNVTDSYLITDGEDLRFCFNIDEGAKSCYDYTAFGRNSELIYDCIRVGINAFNLRFSAFCIDGCSNLFYCRICYGSDSCFGCVGLRKKRFCIFNRQYTEAEYNRLVPRIIDQMRQSGEWGEFFPIEHSPFPYNRTSAQRYFPIDQIEAHRTGLKWYDKPTPDAGNAVSSEDLPDGLPEDDQQLTVRIAENGSVFRITHEELKRYRALSVPLPRLPYDVRLENRARELGGLTLHSRRCAKSGKSLITTFPPSSPWTIWDRDQYEQEFN